MSAWIGAALLVVGFTLLLRVLGLVKVGNDIMQIALDSLESLSSSRLSDDEKESVLQRNSIKLFGSFFKVIGGSAIALLLPVVLLWLLERAGFLSLSSVFSVAASPSFLLASGLALILLLFVGSRARSRRVREVNYSEVDRALHRVAFRTYGLQGRLAGVEDELFARDLSRCESDRPVFITALPRAGTTLLLECFSGVPEFAAHCYRDMPFVLIPCLWNTYSGIFQKDVELQERAHGDGMQIGPDSPEAFEEVLWTNFWQNHYQRDRIIPWGRESHEEFESFFRSHARKIVLLRSRDSAGFTTTRYVSKNNANIARIELLGRLFPDSTTVVPFRDPLQHAASLLQQHLNFLDIHEADDFALEYMRAIGHYDFGKSLRPIDFRGWLDKCSSADTGSIAFWLEYWIACYSYLVEEAPPAIHFIDFDALCDNPARGLSALAEVVGSSEPEALVSRACLIGKPRAKEIDTSALSRALQREAQVVYSRLKAASCN